MLSLHSPAAAIGFAHAVALWRAMPPAPLFTAGVCPEIDPTLAPSQWARQALHFTPEPQPAHILDHPARRLLLSCPGEWGKSTVAALKALHFALSRPKSEVLLLEGHAGGAAAQIVRFAAALGILRNGPPGKTFELTLPNGSKIHDGRAGNSGLDCTAHLVIVDDAALVPERILSTITPLLDRAKGAIWMLSTPRGQTSPFHILWHDTNTPEWSRVNAPAPDTSTRAAPAPSRNPHK